MTENDIVIDVKNITKKFSISKPGILHRILKNEQANNSKLTALGGISFSVSKGEMLGVIGLNGSGKTTLLRAIAGIYRPDSGKITIDGTLAPMLQIGTGFHNEYVAKDNIITYGFLLGLTRTQIEEKIDKIIEFAELEKFVNLPLKHYSSGMRTRLAFSTALQINPDILLVDEILSVGDAKFKEKSFDAFLSFKKSGKTIVYTTHSLGTVSQLCDRVLLIHQGRLVAVGKPEPIIEQYKTILKDHSKN